MREVRRCVCELERAGVVIAHASHSRRDFGQKQRRDNDWIAGFVYRGEDRQALGMSVFVRIECVHEDTRVDGIPHTLDNSPLNPTARTRSGDGHLPSHRRKETYAADGRTKALFEASSSPQEHVPRDRGGCIFACRRSILAGDNRKNNTDGPATMRHKVGRTRLPHVTDDACRMSFQLTDADDVSDRACMPNPIDVVSHVTTSCARPRWDVRVGHRNRVHGTAQGGR